MTGHDWEHALVWEGADLIGHASVIQRRLLLTAAGPRIRGWSPMRRRASSR
jgi:hypothetical protein